MKPKVATAKPANAFTIVGDADFKIEDGVPLPASKKTARQPRYFPLDQLKVGQSFLVRKDKKVGLRPAVVAYRKATGEKGSRWAAAVAGQSGFPLSRSTRERNLPSSPAARCHAMLPGSSSPSASRASPSACAY
jgi:hypothetical protein